MKRILIVGGANGIGLSIAVEMAHRADCERVYVVDKEPFPAEYAHAKISSVQFDLCSEDYSLFDAYTDIDALMMTAGFGRMALFSEIDESTIRRSFEVNTVATLRVIHRFYHRLLSTDTFRCGLMCSIAGYLSSPFFSVYAATKAALRIFCESTNVELEKAGSANRILCVAPGSVRGTRFNGAPTTDLTLTAPLARDIIRHLEEGSDLFIPQYEEVYRQVLQRYHDDFRAEGLHSYDYKVAVRDSRK